jgi:conjugative transfer signal peptidase TraF
MKYRIIRNLALVALMVGTSPAVVRHYRLHFNWTPRAPIGFYHETPAALERGRYVLVRLPERVSELVVRRHYAPISTARTLMPVLKRIAALPGDSVTLSAEGLRVNGRLWPSSKPLTFDYASRPLTHWPFGQYHVAPRQVWLLSDNGRGFDSRYFGPVPISHIKSTVSPVLTK